MYVAFIAISFLLLFNIDLSNICKIIEVIAPLQGAVYASFFENIDAQLIIFVFLISLIYQLIIILIKTYEKQETNPNNILLILIILLEKCV